MRRLKEKSPEAFLLRGFGNKPGNDLLSHARARAVPSALEGLTSEFGMGSGMAPPTSSPEKLYGGRPAAYGQGTPCLKVREEEELLCCGSWTQQKCLQMSLQTVLSPE